MFVNAEQFGVGRGLALLSRNTIPGDPAPPLTAKGQQVVMSVRLLVSPVVPDCWQVGALVVPLSMLVLTARVPPELNVAALPPPSPRTLNSAVLQFPPRPM